MTLTEATTKLEAISLNPCACNVCTHSARLARDALMQVSPLGERLLQTENRDSNEFKALEWSFRQQELTRLSDALDYIKRGEGKCIMQQSVHTPPPEIPSLPYEQGMSDAIERYRKYTMQRKPRIEYKKNPRIPGSYIIK